MRRVIHTRINMVRWIQKEDTVSSGWLIGSKKPLSIGLGTISAFKKLLIF